MPVVIVAAVLVALGLALVGKVQADSAAATPLGDTMQGSAQYTVDVLPAPTANFVDTAVSADPSSDENLMSAAPGAVGVAISTDPASWPAGDKIWDVCRAIATAEGYNTNGAAFKLNNPGDISDGSTTYGSEVHDGSSITHFPDAATGWNWLYQKISNHIAGKSSVYPASLTIAQFAQKYAASWQNWKTNVGNQLGVNPDSTTFAGYVNG